MATETLGDAEGSLQRPAVVRDVKQRCERNPVAHVKASLKAPESDVRSSISRKPSGSLDADQSFLK
jgi:hypothetical protein